LLPYVYSERGDDVLRSYVYSQKGDDVLLPYVYSQIGGDVLLPYAYNLQYRSTGKRLAYLFSEIVIDDVLLPLVFTIKEDSMLCCHIFRVS